MKKAIIAGTSIATMALMAMPALAGFNFPSRPGDDCCGSRDRDKCCPEVTVNSSNDSNVNTVNVSLSNSGLNYTNQYAPMVVKRDYRGSRGTQGVNMAVISTGDTMSIGGVENNVGMNSTSVAPVQGKVTINSNNDSKVKTLNVAVSNSGLNKINQAGNGAAMISSGGAGSAGSVINWVGQNVTEVK